MGHGNVVETGTFTLNSWCICHSHYHFNESSNWKSVQSTVECTHTLVRNYKVIVVIRVKIWRKWVWCDMSWSWFRTEFLYRHGPSCHHIFVSGDWWTGKLIVLSAHAHRYCDEMSLQIHISVIEYRLTQMKKHRLIFQVQVCRVTHFSFIKIKSAHYPQ